MIPGNLITTLKGPLAIYDSKHAYTQLGVMEHDELCILLQKEFDDDTNYFRMSKILRPNGTTAWVQTSGMKSL